MYYKLDKDGFYLGVKSEENQNWDFQTQILLPINFINPRLVNEAWVETFEPEIIVPEKVPLWCLRQKLQEQNLFDLAVQKISFLDEPIKSRALNFLEYGNYVHRDSPTIQMLGELLSMNKNDIDTLFINADKLEL